MFPTISISLPTYNEEKNIRSCLQSLQDLDYPKSKLEVLVIDGGSDDNTVKIAREFSFVKIIKNPKRDTHIAKMLGLINSKGKFWMYYDADLKPNGNDLVKKLIKPLLEDKNIAASYTGYVHHDGDSWIENYINLDSIGRDTVFAWFTPSVESTITKWKNGYAVCKYERDKIPPQGLCLFRRDLLIKLVGKNERFRELDTLSELVRSGHDKFAYVPKPGFYHRHPQNISELRKKRMRNATKNYIPGSREGYIKYKWFNLEKPKDVIKMILLIIYAFSIMGPFLGGIYLSLKKKNIFGMVEFYYVPIVVESYLEAFIRSIEGRKYIYSLINK